MLITPENYAKKLKRFSELQKQIKEMPEVFNSTSFSVKNKLVKFVELDKALKDYDKRTNQKSDG